jgi:hypothetical protein
VTAQLINSLCDSHRRVRFTIGDTGLITFFAAWSFILRERVDDLLFLRISFFSKHFGIAPR